MILLLLDILRMAAGKAGVELALVLFRISIRLKPYVNLQSNISYVKPENLGFYAVQPYHTARNHG